MYCFNCETDLEGVAVNVSLSGTTRCYCSKECATYDTRPRLYPDLERMVEMYQEDKKKDGEHVASLEKLVGSMDFMSESQFLKVSAAIYGMHGDAELAAEMQQLAEECTKKNSFKNMRSRLVFLKLHHRITCLIINAVQLVMRRKQGAFHQFKARIEEAYVDLLELCPNDEQACVTAANMKNWTFFVDEVAVYFVEF